MEIAHKSIQRVYLLQNWVETQSYWMVLFVKTANAIGLLPEKRDKGNLQGQSSCAPDRRGKSQAARDGGGFRLLSHSIGAFQPPPGAALPLHYAQDGQDRPFGQAQDRPFDPAQDRRADSILGGAVAGRGSPACLTAPPRPPIPESGNPAIRIQNQRGRPTENQGRCTRGPGSSRSEPHSGHGVERGPKTRHATHGGRCPVHPGPRGHRPDRRDT
jgi:hypothetical protein